MLTLIDYPIHILAGTESVFSFVQADGTSTMKPVVQTLLKNFHIPGAVDALLRPNFKQHFRAIFAQ